MTRLTFALAALMLAAIAVNAEPIGIGSTLPTYTLPDQFDKEHTLQPETRAVVLSFEMDVSKMINAYLTSKGEDVFAEHNIDYISDISPMPSMIAKMFALPKMRKYGFRLLLNRDDDFKKNYVPEKGKAMVLKLNGQHEVREIWYVANAKELANALGLK